jgi:hypothetical protein
MPKYRAFVHGVNFRLRNQPDGGAEPVGFYVSAFVSAESPDEAESLVIGLLRDEPKLRENAINDRSDPPQLFIEELEEIDDFPADTARPLTGFAFYADPEAEWRTDRNI